jgi:preprotein translocase subunit SecD
MEGIASLVPLILVFLIMYFLLIRPPADEAQGASGHGRALRRGDQVVTSGGIVGRVTRVKDGENELEVEIAPNVNVRVVRSTIQTVRQQDRAARKPDMILIPLWQRLLVALAIVAGILFALPNLFYERVERHNDAEARIEDGPDEPELEADASLWPNWLPTASSSGPRPPRRRLAPGRGPGGGRLRLAHGRAVARDPRRARGRARHGGLRHARGRGDPPSSASASPTRGSRPRARDRARPRPARGHPHRRRRVDIEVAANGDLLTVQLSEAERAATDDRTVRQALEIVRRRIDEVGTREPTIIRQGADRILVEVPGVGSAQEVKDLIGPTAQLTFQPVVQRTTNAEAEPGAGNVLYPSLDEEGVFYVLERAPVVTGEELVDAQPSFDQNGSPAVQFRFNPQGARAFGEYTAETWARPSPSCWTRR